MRQDFTPLVYSVDGMAGRETKQAERQVGFKYGQIVIAMTLVKVKPLLHYKKITG